MAGITQSPRHDLTRLAAVIPDKPIENQAALTGLVIGLSGIDLSAYDFETHRQTLDGSRLTITQEPLAPNFASPALPDPQAPQTRPDPARFLSPGPFIQSDHPEIIQLARSIVREAPDDLKKVRKLVTWVFEQIEKQPTPSIPDALSTLAVKKGDCNEHAVLLAALGRAAGIPTRIETGLTYLDGRFMYHAWNAFFIGHWVTGDAVFNQVPADVTHVGIMTSENEMGTALAGMIGNIQITIVETRQP
jgi:transglutaminase-like putative cysteine protease